MRAALRLGGLVAALGVGYVLFWAAPRKVVLVYDLGPEPAGWLEVDIRRGAELMRHAELSARSGGQVRHTVQLPEGDYVVAWRVDGPAGARTGERPLEVTEDATVVLSLAR